MAYPAAKVANEFISYADHLRQPLTNMQLQKLVYIAHGFYLAWRDEPLVSEEVKAWQWGPVIIPLYEALKQYGAGVVSHKIPTALGLGIDPLGIAMIE